MWEILAVVELTNRIYCTSKGEALKLNQAELNLELLEVITEKGVVRISLGTTGYWNTLKSFAVMKALIGDYQC